MHPVPRHRQTAITIRSDRAAACLAQLMRAGRSQARIIEDALEHAVASEHPAISREAFIAEMTTLLRPLEALRRPTFKQLDDAMWDERGLPR